MSKLDRIYCVVRYLPNNTAMPIRKGSSSWWIPGTVFVEDQVRLFLTAREAQSALNAWRKGGLVKRCLVRDLTREEAANYSQGCLNIRNLVEEWDAQAGGGPMDAEDEATFPGPIYVQRLQVPGWDAKARQMCYDLVVEPVFFNKAQV